MTVTYVANAKNATAMKRSFPVPTVRKCLISRFKGEQTPDCPGFMVICRMPTRPGASSAATSVFSPPGVVVGFTLRQLECFLAVADAGSLAAAATALRASDSAVSDALTAMEKSIGAVLFHRQRARGATLTSDGAAILPHARRVLAEAEALASAAGRRGTTVAGPVRVGAVGTLGPTLVPRIMREIGVRYPGVRVDYRTADRSSMLRSLADAEVDVVLSFDIDLSPAFVKTTLYRTEACIVVPADHPLADRPAATLEEIAHEPMVLLDIELSRVHTLELMSSSGITPDIAYRTESYDLCRSLVGRGFGYTLLLWREGIGPAPDGSALSIVRITPTPRPVGVVLVTAAGPISPRVRAFTEVATELFTPTV